MRPGLAIIGTASLVCKENRHSRKLVYNVVQTRYIARFRPTVGFSVGDASQASRVTIVGGFDDASQKDEEALRVAGCKVERLAGRDYDETKALLDRLAQSGEPFLSLS